MTEKTEKQKQQETDTLIKIIILPLVIGFALVFSGITMTLFKVIGWCLLIFGILTGSLYLFKLYITHKEKIKKTKEELLGLVKKEKEGGKK